jgi:GNAT superfamily N-acetyltransferase
MHTPDGTPTLRRAVPADAAACATLVRALSPAFFEFPDRRGTEPFFESINEAAQARAIASSTYWVAEHQGQLVGLAGLRAPRHVFHLFVAPAFQGKGLGRRLLATLLSTGEPTLPVTVNASLPALGFYARMGFVAVEAVKTVHGVRFQPMVRQP